MFYAFYYEIMNFFILNYANFHNLIKIKHNVPRRTRHALVVNLTPYANAALPELGRNMCGSTATPQSG